MSTDTVKYLYLGVSECAFGFSLKDGSQWPGVNHGETKQHDIVVSVRKLVLCQRTQNYRGYLCAEELERPNA